MNHHAGIVLAAGESQRMGTPKALLPTPDRVPLARRQAQLLEQSGCDKTVIVLGSEHEHNALKLDWPDIAVNKEWKSKGRFSSVQTGLRCLSGYDGYFILPVDSPGIRPETVTMLRGAAESGDCKVIRPMYNGQPGHIAFLSAATALRILDTDAGENKRLDQVLKPLECLIEVDDPAVLHNVNTPEDWKEACRNLGW